MLNPLTLLADDDSNIVDEIKYCGMIDSLLYLAAIRSDILFSIYKYTRFQSAPKESHLTIVKQIIKYLIRTMSLRI